MIEALYQDIEFAMEHRDLQSSLGGSSYYGFDLEEWFREYSHCRTLGPVNIPNIAFHKIKVHSIVDRDTNRDNSGTFTWFVTQDGNDIG